jgi:hypothetical protein
MNASLRDKYLEKKVKKKASKVLPELKVLQLSIFFESLANPRFLA